MLNTAFSPWPSYTAEEMDAVSRVLETNRVNYWTGSEAKTFEKEFAAWVGTAHAIALANGTVALELALKVLEIGSGDEVIVTPRTFIASAGAIVLSGARPVFADVDLESQNITARTVERVLTTRTKAILCVHLAGWPCEMDELRELAQQHRLHLIEDCAQAHGAHYKGTSVGALGDVAAWSFCQDKIMTTGGEGGMLTLDDELRWKAGWAFKDHGKSWDAVQRPHPPGYRWLHESFGTNWRMTEMQAALGRVQLSRMTVWHEARRSNAARILDCCERHAALRVPRPPRHVEHAWYKCYVFIRPERLAKGWSRDRIVSEINELEVPCYTGSCSEVYLEKAFDGSSLRPERRLSNAQELGETSLMFLVHPNLREREIEKTCSVIDAVMARASR